MNFSRVNLASFLLAGLLALNGSLPAKFTLPLVDVPKNISGAASSMAIWSSTDVTVSAGSWITINFPAGTTLPNPPTIYDCNCLVMKFTEYCVTCTPQTYSFTPNEVTVTSGVVTSNGVNFQIPVSSAQNPSTGAINKGKFYIRFRSTFGLYNPPSSGLSTLTLVDPDGNALASKAYFIASAATTDVSLVSLSGTVTIDGTTNPSVGALVMASTDGISGFHPTSYAGPGTGTAGTSLSWARSVTSNAYTATTDYNGGYRMLVPAGTYTVQAFASRVTLSAGAAYLENVNSTASSPLSVVNATTVNLTVPVFNP